VAGIAEVLHARFVDHTYPMHTHDQWTLLIVDDGVIRYDLDRHEHGAIAAEVTLLPPHVPHDGRAATPHGFRKRVLYLDESWLPGPAREPNLRDSMLRDRVHRLHEALDDPFEAESRLAFVRDRLLTHLRASAEPVRRGASARLASRLRELLDARVTSGLTLAEAADLLRAHQVHLVRSFSATFGVAPHAYLTGRRIDLARRALLTGHAAAEVATMVGFCDQAHLTRQCKRYLGVTPARFARGRSESTTSAERPSVSARTASRPSPSRAG
jgi:AraC-like DNA-binding protein